MFNSLIAKFSGINFFVVITYILFIITILKLSGCQTISNVRVSSDEISEDSDYDIVQVVMNDGTVIDVKDKNAKFLLKYETVKNVIVYSNSKKDNSGVEKTVIELKDINSIIIEEGSKAENIVLIVLAVAGGILLIYGLVIVITLLNAAS